MGLDDQVRATLLLMRDLRAAQKEFFKTKDRNVLVKCKAMERAVDEAIDKALAPTNREPGSLL